MGPVFVGGASRSGKTLVRWLLSSHSRLAVSRRTELWPRFRERYGDLADPANLGRCLRAMLARKQVAALDPDPERLRRDLAAGDASYARLFALVHEHWADRLGKARWGDQTGGIEEFADEVLAAYDGARIVHVVRDPRDVCAAVLERGEAGRFAVERTAAAWLRSAELAAHHAPRHPDAYLVVRYETLVTEPEATARQLCAFLGEDFEPHMLRIEGAERYDEARAASADGCPISPFAVGAYHRTLPRRAVAFVQSAAGDQMRALGYPPDETSVTGVDRARLAASALPFRLARAKAARRTLPPARPVTTAPRPTSEVAP